jgi:hypothetical protein
MCNATTALTPSLRAVCREDEGHDGPHRSNRGVLIIWGVGRDSFSPEKVEGPGEFN